MSQSRVATILIQSPGPLQTYDRRVMRIYVWLYCALGIFLPLTLLAVGNCGLVKALRGSTRLRRQFHVRNAHIDANERVTTVLATVVSQGHSRSYKDVRTIHTTTYWPRDAPFRRFPLPMGRIRVRVRVRG